ncbi:MAG: hypothetical protein GTO14_26070 [Anaerolineales bacterium]|nr:hypothetical protein [Anaerolineales bacterium]
MRRSAIQEKTKDLLLALGLLAVGIVALVAINASKEGSRIASAAALTYAAMPSIYAWLLISLVGLFMATTLRGMWIERLATKRDEEEETAAPGNEAQSDLEASAVRRKTILLRTWGTLGVLLAYVLLLEYVHFIILTTLFLSAMFLVFGQRSIKKIIALSICGGAAFYFLFIYLLNLPI